MNCDSKEFVLLLENLIIKGSTSGNGICHEISYIKLTFLRIWLLNQIANWPLCVRKPDGSPNLMYPVPAPDGSCSGRAYHSSKDKWEGEYGSLRKDLAAFLIKRLTDTCMTNKIAFFITTISLYESFTPDILVDLKSIGRKIKSTKSAACKVKRFYDLGILERKWVVDGVRSHYIYRVRYSPLTVGFTKKRWKPSKKTSRKYVRSWHYV